MVGYVLVCRLGDFRLRDTADAAALGIGVLLMSLSATRSFGRFNGGGTPDRP